MFNLNIAQFYDWNPTVFLDCSGLSVGTYYCVSLYPGGQPPGEAYTDDGANSTATATSNGVSTPSPIQTGIVADCDMFYEVQNLDDCQIIATKYNISLAIFYSWNPAIGSSCAYLETSVYVCVAVLSASSITATSTAAASTTTAVVSTPSPVQTGMVLDCGLFYEVESGNDCSDIAAAYSISLSTFYDWNPAVGSSCLYLEANVYVCVGLLGSSSMTSVTPTTLSSSSGVSTPTPVQTGIVSNCNAFYEVQSGNTCYGIAEDYGIALDAFYAWNPAVGTTCQYLELDVYVCVGVQ